MTSGDVLSGGVGGAELITALEFMTSNLQRSYILVTRTNIGDKTRKEQLALLNYTWCNLQAVKRRKQR